MNKRQHELYKKLMPLIPIKEIEEEEIIKFEHDFTYKRGMKKFLIIEDLDIINFFVMKLIEKEQDYIKNIRNPNHPDYQEEKWEQQQDKNISKRRINKLLDVLEDVLKNKEPGWVLTFHDNDNMNAEYPFIFALSKRNNLEQYDLHLGIDYKLMSELFCILEGREIEKAISPANKSTPTKSTGARL